MKQTELLGKIRSSLKVSHFPTPATVRLSYGFSVPYLNELINSIDEPKYAKLSLTHSVLDAPTWLLPLVSEIRNLCGVYIYLDNVLPENYVNPVKGYTIIGDQYLARAAAVYIDFTYTSIDRSVNKILLENRKLRRQKRDKNANVASTKRVVDHRKEFIAHILNTDILKPSDKAIDFRDEIKQLVKHKQELWKIPTEALYT